jgi:hypothetical protein
VAFYVGGAFFPGELCHTLDKADCMRGKEHQQALLRASATITFDT